MIKKSQNLTVKRAFSLLALMLIGVGMIFAAVRQDPGATRRIWDAEYLKKKNNKTTAKKSTPPRRYRVVTPQLSTSQVAGDTVLGITLWRLKPSSAADDKEVRIIRHRRDKAQTASFTPERIPADTPLEPDQRFRISIEAARTGYLYVINREQYADGSTGDPYLIFPTLSLRGGDNRVSVGKMIDLPDLEDDPNYFTLEPSRSDQIGELVTVIVSPQPLPDLKIGEHEVQLPAEQVEKWEKAWGTQVGRIELEGGAGKKWTREEKTAGASRDRRLKDTDPPPQTVFYRPGAKPDEPFLVSLNLNYKTLGRK